MHNLEGGTTLEALFRAKKSLYFNSLQRTSVNLFHTDFMSVKRKILMAKQGFFQQKESFSRIQIYDVVAVHFGIGLKL